MDYVNLGFDKKISANPSEMVRDGQSDCEK